MKNDGTLQQHRTVQRFMTPHAGEGMDVQMRLRVDMQRNNGECRQKAKDIQPPNAFGMAVFHGKNLISLRLPDIILDGNKQRGVG